MTWLIACERSGTIRDAMLAVGVDAVSCDLEPSRTPGPHIQGDALEQIDRRWAGVIAHPTCRYLTNSGVCHLYDGLRKENGRFEPRWVLMREAAAFFNAFKRANAPKIAIENPIVHSHARAIIGSQTQTVQPWWFGDEAFKATCFWLTGLPPLVATNRLTPPKYGTEAYKRWSFLHRAPPGPGREELRSKTFPGIAAAAVAQWALTEHVGGAR